MFSHFLPAQPFLVMQYCGFGNLCHYLTDHPDAKRIDLVRIAFAEQGGIITRYDKVYDIVAGMTYLHGKNIVHADLKGVDAMFRSREPSLTG